MKNKVKKYYILLALLSPYIFLVWGYYLYNMYHGNFISRYTLSINTSEKYFVPKNQINIFPVKNNYPVRGKTPKVNKDSLKVEYLKADENGRLDVGNGQMIYTEPNSIIIKVPPKTEGRKSVQMNPLDTTYGIQPKTADAFLSTGTGWMRWLNGQPVDEGWEMGPPVTYPAWRNGIQLYQPVTFTFEAHFENYPPYSPIKHNKFRFYHVINIPPIDTMNYNPTIALLRAFLASQGEPYSIYNALMFFVLARGPPLYQIPTKYAILASWETDSIGAITIARGPPLLAVIGCCDAYLTSGDVRTATGAAKPNSLINGNGNDLTFGYIAGIMGAWDNWLNQSYTCLLITEVISINPISTLMPDKYLLYQNYPNPFNSTTNIKFDVKKEGTVSIKVYDMLGKEVTTIVNKKMEPGKYEASWDAGALSTGVYLYRMQVQDYFETKKMILMK